jgi:hypothetical protein
MHTYIIFGFDLASAVEGAVTGPQLAGFLAAVILS